MKSQARLTTLQDLLNDYDTARREQYYEKTTEIIKHLTSAASKGSKNVILALGLLYVEEGNYTKAFEWLYKIKDDDQDAAFHVGRILIEGAKNSTGKFTVKPNPEKGQAILATITNSKKYLAKYWLAMSYSSECDQDKKVQLLKEAKEHIQLARIELENITQKKQAEEKLAQLIKAAKENDLESQLAVAMHFKLQKGYEIKSFRYFKKAAKQGHPEAQYQVGLCYKNGFGTRANLQLAQKWFQKSSPQHKGAYAELHPWRLPDFSRWLSVIPNFFRTLCRTKPRVIVKEVINEAPLMVPKPVAVKEKKRREKLAIQQDIPSDTSFFTGPLNTLNQRIKRNSKVLEHKSDPLFDILKLIEKSLKDKTTWLEVFKKIKQDYSSELKKWNATKLLIKKLFRDDSLDFFNFLVELKQKKSIDLIRICLPEYVEHLKKIEAQGCDILSWIRSELAAGKNLANILYTVIIYENKSELSEKLFNYHLQSVSAKVLNKAAIDKKSVAENLSNLHQYIVKVDLAKLAALEKDKMPTYSEQLEEKETITQQAVERPFIAPDLQELLFNLRGGLEPKKPIIPLVEAKKLEHKEIPITGVTVFIPSDAQFIMKLLLQHNFKVYMNGSRVFNPIISPYDDSIRDVDLVTNATQEDVARIFAASKIPVKPVSAGSTTSPIALCKTKLIHDFDIRCGANLDKLVNDIPGHDMTFRGMYASIEGEVFDPSGRSFKDNLENQIYFFEPGAKALFESDPARILATIFAMSCGKQLQPEDGHALKLSLPALAQVVETNAARLLFPLLKNFTRGNSRLNFELLLHFGVFDVLFPSKQQIFTEQNEHLAYIFSLLDGVVNSGARVWLPHIYSQILYTRMVPYVDIDETIDSLKLIKCQGGKVAGIKEMAISYYEEMSRRLAPEPFMLKQGYFFGREEYESKVTFPSILFTEEKVQGYRY